MLLELLYAALRSEHGICVWSTDPDRLRKKLYPILRQYPDEEGFASLSFAISPLHPHDLWIVKKVNPDASDS